MTTNLPAIRTPVRPAPASAPRPTDARAPRPGLAGRLLIGAAVPAAIAPVANDRFGRLLLLALSAVFVLWALVETVRRMSRMSPTSAISPISPQVRPPLRALEASPTPAQRRR